MIGNGDVFVTARNRGVCHRANITGAIAPICVHLQIAPNARAPRRGFGQPKATFGESEEFSPQRRRSRGMLLPPNPLADLFLKEWSNMRQLYQRALLCDQIPGLNLPEKCAARGPAIGPLQNIGSFTRFPRK